MSGTSEIKMVEANQVVANPSPETTDCNANGSSEGAKNNGNYPAIRRRLPDERHSLTHHFSIGGQEGYVTVGLYEDGTPGEMFIRMAKEGSTVSGLMDSFATAVSLALQYVCRCNSFATSQPHPV
jgi:ribonucleoside-diphosphate reductase alpha chain